MSKKAKIFIFVSVSVSLSPVLQSKFIKRPKKPRDKKFPSSSMRYMDVKAWEILKTNVKENPRLLLFIFLICLHADI